PAAGGVELLGGAEQLRPTAPAGVHPGGLGVGVFADEGPLGAGLAQHLVLRLAEAFTPLGLGQLEGRGRLAHDSTVDPAAAVGTRRSSGGSMPSSSRPSARATR